MPKVIISQEELPIPISDFINKFEYRVVNENRNLFSDWSVINFIRQNTLLRKEFDTLPPGGNPDDVLVILPEPDDGWESGWRPISDLLSSEFVTEDENHDIPAGGLATQVLTKASDTNYDVYWDYAQGVPEGGLTGESLVKNSGTDFDVSWKKIVDPQDSNFIIAISMFA